MQRKWIADTLRSARLLGDDDSEYFCRALLLIEWRDNTLVKLDEPKSTESL
jgi:hypothetical protein